MCSTESTNATNRVLTQLANGAHALSTHTGHMPSSTQGTQVHGVQPKWSAHMAKLKAACE